MITRDRLLKILEAIAEEIKNQKQFLTDLDAAIGDGDHGINMSRGFEAVLAKLPTLADKDIGSILKAIGTTLVSTVGGAAGPLYGTAFMKAGQVMVDKMELDANDLKKVLQSALEGIKMRGKAQKGEKTMIDAIEPALDAYNKALEEGLSMKKAMNNAVEAAREGVEYTKTIVATKGRANYLGERSIGHQDPGATSSYLMLRVVSENIEE